MGNLMKCNKPVFLLVIIAFAAIGIPACVSNDTSSSNDAPPLLPPPEEPTLESPIVYWSYFGDRGPEFWYYLAPSFYLAREGQAQSPIDISTSSLSFMPGLEKPVFHYRDSDYILYDNSHTIQVIPQAQDSRITLDGRDYILRYFEFHVPSEHTIDGKRFEMEIQFFHEDAAGNKAVVAVLLEEGEENRDLKEVFSYMSWIPVGGVFELEEPFNPGRLFDKTVSLYRYDGSLTIPPCTEGIKWNIYSQPLNAAKYQLEAFKAIYLRNSRPVQNLNGRSVFITK
jgi:carbonic anhydrase